MFALASAFKEGDLRVGGTSDDRLRDDARRALLATTIGDIHRAVFVEDGVTAALQRSRDRRHDEELSSLTIAQARGALLGPQGAEWARRHQRGLGSEAIAALVKVMTDEELSTVARASVSIPSTLGGVGDRCAAAFRLAHPAEQPGDDEQEILFSILEGLSYGCGDVISA